MALLRYMLSAREKYSFNVIAINVEHGIRGESSMRDTAFVLDRCARLGVSCVSYKVDAPSYAKAHKLSIEQAGRELRYKCFYETLDGGKCDLIATAHHRSDNVESVLFNLFRGTGLKGLAGINASYGDKIIRPFLNVAKEEIDEYIKENSIPFVTDETNFSDDYTRNFLRLNVIPKIKEAFPEMEKSVARFSEIARAEDEYLTEMAETTLDVYDGRVEISVSTHPVILARAIMEGLKTLGVEKDWEKAHIDGVISLVNLQNGAKISLPKNLYAVREYDKIVITTTADVISTVIPFGLGEFTFGDYALEILPVSTPRDLKDGFYVDVDKIPKTAIIRSKTDGDVFKKFGGGTKKLNDYLTDVKIPARLRSGLPILADGKDVLIIFGVAISDKIKVDGTTSRIAKLKVKKI